MSILPKPGMAKEALTAIACSSGLGQAAAMLQALPVAAALLAAAPAAAQESGAEPPAPAPSAGAIPAFDISAELNLYSDYRFRGVSRSDEAPAVQAGLTIRHESGIYAGARGTSLAGNDGFRLRNPAFVDQGDAEIDLYAGYGRSLGGGFDLDAGLMYYAFAGGRGATDHVEPYASLSYLIGPAQLTGGVKYAPSQAGTGHRDMVYLYGQLDVSVPFRPWSFSAQAGRQDWGAYGSYWNWSLGARYHVRLPGLPNAEIGLRYVDTDLPSVHGQDGGVQASVEVSF
jgi:uncharacterized protein (TIGR02001 family)